jgi:hypothetical protein
MQNVLTLEFSKNYCINFILKKVEKINKEKSMGYFVRFPKSGTFKIKELFF